jgi:histidinol-phosphate aminotransferase
MVENNNSFFRNNIDQMSGYMPGEQPERIGGWIKLNTNENPYPPSPKVKEVLNNFSYENLRLYPNPIADELRSIIAEIHNLKPDNVIAGNGSDDILTIAIRCFVGEGEFVACPEPSYSLYPVLTQIQAGKCLKIQLNDDFSLPQNFNQSAAPAKLILIPRPNAPTGNAFNLDAMHKLCSEFDGIVLIDEAYADFADDNCIDFVSQYSNVIVSRTLSKSYSLAGIRFGFALASQNLINGMMKVKDSYNVNMLTQKIAAAALNDQKYFLDTLNKIKATRKDFTLKLLSAGFDVLLSKANFVFTSPPKGNADELYSYLKNNGVLVRYFPGALTRNYVRITIGTEHEMKILFDLINEF